MSNKLPNPPLEIVFVTSDYKLFDTAKKARYHEINIKLKRLVNTVMLRRTLKHIDVSFKSF